MRQYIYVGKSKIDDRLEVFRSKVKPSISNLGATYLYCIGPFRTIRGATFCAEHPYSTCQTVKEYERSALVHKGQSELCAAYGKHLDKMIYEKNAKRILDKP